MRDGAKAIGFDDAHLYEELELEPSRRAVPMQQALRREAQQVMQTWQQVPESRRY